MKESRSAFFAHHDPALIDKIRKAVVSIAGAGGLGSNVAYSLARVGIGKLIIADFDIIEISNLNRQQYFIDQVGQLKVDALKHNLGKIQPFSEYIMHNIKIDEDNISQIFGEADLLIEAFDKAVMKKMLIEKWISLFPDKPVICASGLAGYGRNDIIGIQKIDNLYICGDQISETSGSISPMAPRVGIVANMQANLALEILFQDISAGSCNENID